VAPRARAKKKKGSLLTLGALASIVSICGVVYQIYHTREQDGEKAAAAAARVHHARLIFHVTIGPQGAILSAAYGHVTIDPIPPLNASGVVTVTIDGSTCPTSAELEVEHNDVRLTVSRCMIPSGSTGELTWTDSPPTVQSED
jgi:hypothetical protein